MAMSKTQGGVVAYSNVSLKPTLASIKNACEYMGGISRAKFYADILPLLETVKLGSRNFVVVSSMDRFLEANRKRAR
jgi:hypothetical protein